MTRQISMVLVVASLLFGGCEKSMTIPEYRSWLFSDESGLTSTVRRGDREYSITILPVKWRQTVNPEASGTVAALLTITPADPTVPDASFDGVTSFEQYGERVADIAFHIPQMTTLLIDGKEVKAIGAQLAYAQSLKRPVSLYVTFNIDEETLRQGSEITIQFDDQVYGEGKMIHHFSIENIASRVPEGTS
ncbi:MAG: hypothetical protein IPH85_14465 [Ignavibacteria bacterium]|nr:hypothetical protein [Ignavibacteria bacterium]MBK7034414.1 hypothetical protein [Ignavibacteria bacterium]MBK7187092.1 hypothetical protein [Ignavibacteria bacterium]MBK7578507.1 hypothetical protein [Ignavibacteria bacterium]MBK9182074.1 hypothetical protein [Ignavibacteria bacterium]